jgi:hypothetical protein
MFKLAYWKLIFNMLTLDPPPQTGAPSTVVPGSSADTVVPVVSVSPPPSPPPSTPLVVEAPSDVGHPSPAPPSCNAVRNDDSDSDDDDDAVADARPALRSRKRIVVDDEEDADGDTDTETSGGESCDIPDDARGDVEADSAPGQAYLHGITRYLDSIIQENASSIDKAEEFLDPIWKSRRPTYYTLNDTAEEAHERRQDEMRLVKSVQSHKCRDVCYKYGHKTCRFNFPRPLIPETYFKDGVIFAKRENRWCNNFNRAMLSVLRSNHDLKFLTTGADSKATIFYITDYVTKSEQKHIQTVTFLKIAVDKINAAEFGPKKANKKLSAEENQARNRITTFLHVMDTSVERSGQWCTLVLLGLPLEYKSHTFKSFCCSSFISRAKLANSTDADPVEDFVESLTPILNMDSPDEEITFASQYADYRYRSKVRSDPLYNRHAAAHLFAPYEKSASGSEMEMELAQMTPYHYIQRVEKTKMTPKTYAALLRGKQPFNHVRFNPAHPQFRTHLQIVRDVSNPTIPHPIPVLLGYSLPSKSDDPDSYALSILSLLSVYDDPSDLKPDDSLDWPQTLIAYKRRLAHLDPHRAEWMDQIISNLTCIADGRQAQKLEKDERRRLRDLEDPNWNDKSEVDGANDYTGDIDETGYQDESEPTNGEVSEVVIDMLPPFGPSSLPQHFAPILSTYSSIHPSTDRLAAALQETTHLSTGDLHSAADMKVQMSELKTKLQEFKDTMNERDYNGADLTSDWPKRLVKAGKLDKDQLAAFLLAAMHVLRCETYVLNQQLKNPDPNMKKPPPMTLYLGGEGGTGKSAVLKAFTEFLCVVNLRHTLRIGASTGVAAGNVGGSTLSSLLGTGKNSNAPSLRVTEKLRRDFQHVTMLFVDEISMVGTRAYANLNQRLQTIKSNKLPFGGLSLILAGDFYQIPPIGDNPMYKMPIDENLKKGDNLSDNLRGYNHFLSCTHAVFLTKQYRMAEDQDYLELVKRFRHGRQNTDAEFDDEIYLRSKQLTASNTLRSGHLKDVAEDPVVIVTKHNLRYAINIKKAHEMAKATKQKLLFSVGVDTSSSHHLTAAMRQLLLLMYDGCSTEYAAGLLPLMIGMPVMLKQNLATELKLNNGTIGVVTKIILDEREVVSHPDDLARPHYLRYQPIVHVLFGECVEIFKLGDLPAGVVPISTQKGSQTFTTSFTVSIPGARDLTVQRKQLAILPAWAITVNSSQGRSLDTAVIDISGIHKSAEKPYVMISRLKTGDFGVQGEWDPSFWTVKPNFTMQNFVKRKLASVARRTSRHLPELDDLVGQYTLVTKLLQKIKAERRQNPPPAPRRKAKFNPPAPPHVATDVDSDDVDSDNDVSDLISGSENNSDNDDDDDDAVAEARPALRSRKRIVVDVDETVDEDTDTETS